MILYYDFEGKRMHAEVDWPTAAGTITVQLTDKRLKNFPGDLLFDVNRYNKVSYMVENASDRRLTNLQMVLWKRLQEVASQGIPKNSH